MKARIIIGLLITASLALLVNGLYGESEESLRVGVFLYWLGGSLNLAVAGCAALGVLVALFITEWKPANEDTLKKLREKSFGLFLWKNTMRLMNLTGTVLLIMHGFVWLPTFYVLSTVIAILGNLFFIEALIVAKKNCEKAAEEEGES